jgi:hypothetical protein
MKKTVLITLLMLVAVFVYAEKLATLEGIGKVKSIIVDNQQLYVAEVSSVRIYSLKDYRLVKQFGKAGQGPQEFWVIPQLPLLLDVKTDKLMVGSVGKLSFFKKDGTFITESRYSPQTGFFLRTLGKDKYVGMSNKGVDETLYRRLSLYDSEVKAVKEIITVEHDYQGPGKGLRLLKNTFAYRCHDNKIFVSSTKDFVIDVFNNEGNKIYTIKRPYERRDVTGEIKDKLLNFLKTHPNTRDQFEFLKPIIFPDKFPAIAALMVTDGRIYVMTFKEKKTDDNKKIEFLILGLDGKLLKKEFITVRYMNEMETYPFEIKNGKFYQLVENEDTEEWELHCHTIIK